MIIIIIIIIQGDNKHESDQIDNRAGSSSINQLRGELRVDDRYLSDGAISWR